MRKIEETKTRFYFAADSDVIINLSLIADGRKRKFETEVLGQCNYNLWKMVYDGDVKLYITPQILCELGRLNAKFDEHFASRSNAFVLSNIAKFVRIFCHPIYINPNDELDFKRKVRELAICYCLEAGMEYKTITRKNGTQIVVPCRDAKALAEASFCGLSFLTINTKDFIATRLENGVFISDKLEKIKEINKRFGLRYQQKDVAWTDCPMPMSLVDFIRHIPNCYMDIPFFPDTNYLEKPLQHYEIDHAGNSSKFFKSLDAFLKQVENGKIEIKRFGIRQPYWFRKINNENGDEAKINEQIIKYSK